MKKSSGKTKENEQADILKKILKRTEDAAVDIHEMKSDYKHVNLRLNIVEHSTQVTKADTEKMREEMGKLRNDIFNRLDDISAQLENLQQDKVIGVYQTKELKTEVDRHEKRLKKLEQTVQSA